ncbi:hypothetical protein L0244_01440 [bacterium]|nr:hypothetical protein [bacterium]
MSRSFDHNHHLEDMLFGTLDVEDGRPVATPDQLRLHQVGEKIIRGLGFLLFGKPIEPEVKISTQFFETEAIPHELNRALTRVPFIQDYAPDFIYRYKSIDSTQYESLWQLSFFGDFHCFAGIKKK